MQVLVEPGQTPSGFGLALHEVKMFTGKPPMWSLRPLSPCCGAFIEHGETAEDDLHCSKCATSWQAFSDGCRGTIGNDVPIDTARNVKGDVTLSRWFARIMGYPNAENNHEVEVSFKWS